MPVFPLGAFKVLSELTFQGRFEDRYSGIGYHL